HLIQVAYFTALFPYVVLFTLLGRGASLPGAVDGILYFITPQWHKLLDPNVWYAAVAQSFFSLSVGFGAIINLASFNSFKHNVYRDAWIISLADTLTSLLAGFTIFAILGNLAYELDTDVENVVRGGSGLAFVSYPDALAKFTWAPQLFAVLFFLMLFTLGVGSAAGLTSNIITIICEQFPSLNKAYATIAICITGFLVGLIYITPGGQWILDLVDFFGGGFIIYILVIVETVAINYIYGTKRFLSDLNFMLNIELGLYWKFCWAFIIPVGLTAILIYSLVDFTLPTFENKPYPDSAYLCGWLLAVASLGMVPLCFFHAVYNNGKSTFSEKVKNVFQPKDTWGPKKRVNREEWKKLSQ
ncbi:sodium-dependent nutrient amino acid transporter 1-like, partial [Homarus americanus]|uniref:sodium-dependent nutrient amino acid transporter 1-like n=1 Tax=Homarus americanus TaxID=6706 RepID=UPI001C4421F1